PRTTPPSSAIDPAGWRAHVPVRARCRQRGSAGFGRVATGMPVAVASLTRRPGRPGRGWPIDRINNMRNCRQYRLNLRMVFGTGLGVGIRVGWGGGAEDPVQTTSAALISTSTANVHLQELTNSCGANQAQDFFKVVNAGTTPIPASDVSIKIWVDDT